MVTDTALERYNWLRLQAEELERMAGEGSYGGTSYWANKHECTRGAIASADFVPPAEMRYALSKEAIIAVHRVAEAAFDAIWKAAAEALRKDAKGLRDALEAQASELAERLKHFDDK